MKRGVLPILLFFGFQLVAQELQVVELSFTGLKRTKDSFLERLVKTKVNASYDSVLVGEDIERLKRLPGIASASVKKKVEENNVSLTYTIVENFTIIPGLRIAQANDDSFAYRVSLFEFNFLGNNQLIGAYYEKNVFDSFGLFWEHPFLFSDKLGVGFNYQDRTTQEPVFFQQGDKNYQFNSRSVEGNLLFSFNFKNEASLGASLLKESYIFTEESPLPGAPLRLEADKLVYKAVYRFVDLDIDYQYFDGLVSEFTGQYVHLVNGDAQAKTFLRSFASLRNDLIYYRKVKKHGNWASRLRFATAIGNEDSPFAPFTLDNQLNIRGVGNTVDRGISALVLNTEYRQTFYERGWFAVQGNIFADMGSWQEPGERFSQLFNGTSTRFYTGLGFRLIHKKIFNAVFRLDYGIGVGNDATKGVVFGIGQYF